MIGAVSYTFCSGGNEVLSMYAGQAVIQFAKQKDSTLEYAIKFYLSKAAYVEEAALYNDCSSPLGVPLGQIYKPSRYLTISFRFELSSLLPYIHLEQRVGEM